MILGGDAVAPRREAGQASSMLEQTRSDKHVDESGDVGQRTIASVPDDPVDALLGHAWRRMRADCCQSLRKPPKSDSGKPVVDLRRHEPSPSK
jgi:hypothetical protein